MNVARECDVVLSLIDFGTNTGADLELLSGGVGDVVFAGVGAVGNAAIWALGRHTSLTGNLWLVDDDIFLLPNLQRYILGISRDVSRPKIKIGAKALSQGSLVVQPCRQKLESFAQKLAGFRIPTICISVDNIQTRRAAQALLPRLIVNGWTGDQSLGASWHLFSREAACLACLYHPLGQGLSQPEQAAKAFGLSPQRANELWVTRVPPSQEDLKIIARTLGVNDADLNRWRGKNLGELYTGVVCGAVPLNMPTVGRIETVPLAHQSAL